MIVWLASYPRSGNTFIRLLLHHYFNVATLDRYIPKIEPLGPRDKNHIAELVGYRPIDSLEDLDAETEPAFVKTHELPDDDRPAIYVIRDGRDAITSYAHFVLTLEENCPKDEYEERFRKTIGHLVTDTERFGGWGAHVRAWTERQAPTAIVHYTQLQRRPYETLRLALSQLSLDTRIKTAGLRRRPVKFRELQRMSPQLFRKGKVGSYSDEMPEEVEQMFWEQYGDIMEQFGYQRRNRWNRIKDFWRKSIRCKSDRLDESPSK